MYKFNLPLPPSINNYYGSHCKFSYATVYIKQKGKEYRKAVLDYVVENDLQLRANTLLTLDIIVHPKDNRKWDLDNRLKAVLDALTHAEVWDDDSLIFKINMEKGDKTEKGGINIEISPYIS